MQNQAREAHLVESETPVLLLLLLVLCFSFAEVSFDFEDGDETFDVAEERPYREAGSMSSSNTKTY